jgi:hypothetical protein
MEGLYGWDSGVNDELEALAAFLGETLHVDVNDARKEIVLTVECTPRTAANSAICFVSCILQIRVPVGYPDTQRPAISIRNSCGMMDEGAAITTTLRKFAESLPLGEPALFQTIEKASDYLDDMNDGECMVCADSLSSNCFISAATAKKGLLETAVKTACNHCFHNDCLAKWAAISIIKRRSGRKALQVREKDDLLIRSSEGQLKARWQELQTQESCRAGLLSEQEDMSRCIDILKRMQAEGSDQASACQDKLGNDITLSQAKSRLFKAKSDAVFVEEKIDTIQKRWAQWQIPHITVITFIYCRISGDERELINLKESLKSAQSHEDLKKLFPCPYCRLELSGQCISVNLAAGAVTSSIDPIWQSKLEFYLTEEERSVTISQDLGVLADVGGSKLAEQSDDILEYIRSVQSYQNSLRQKLICCSDYNAATGTGTEASPLVAAEGVHSALLGTDAATAAPHVSSEYSVSQPRRHKGSRRSKKS